MSDKEIINGSSGKWTLCLWRIRTCRHRQREEGNDAYTYWHWGYILFTAKWSFWGYHSLHVMNNKRGPPLTLLLSQFKDDDSFVLVQSCQKGGYLFQYQLHLWCFNPNFSTIHVHECGASIIKIDTSNIP